MPLPFAAAGLFLKTMSPTQWIMVGMGVAIAGLLFAVKVQGVRIDSAHNKIRSLELDIKERDDKIDKQNAGIKSLEDAKKSLETNLNKARATNAQKQKELDTALNTIKNTPIPADTQGRVDYLLDAFKESAKAWNAK